MKLHVQIYFRFREIMIQKKQHVNSVTYTFILAKFTSQNSNMFEI